MAIFGKQAFVLYQLNKLLTLVVFIHINYGKVFDSKFIYVSVKSLITVVIHIDNDSYSPLFTCII